MKLFSTAVAAAALTLAASAPAHAEGLIDVLLNFEDAQGYLNPLPATTVNGVAVTFGNDAVGLVNDGLGNGLNGEYFTNAPSPVGVMLAAAPLGATLDASINVGVGFVNSFSFYYSSSSAVTGAVQIWSGLNGTGTQLASIDLSANATNGCSDSDACHFDQIVANFSGVAQSVTFAPTYTALFDNVQLQAVPEPTTSAALLAGLGVLGLVARRRRG